MIDVNPDVLNDDCVQNAKKVLWSLAHIMNHDPCRRFVFGFTIENLWLRVWFCDRAGFLVSDLVNITEKVRSSVSRYQSPHILRDKLL